MKYIEGRNRNQHILLPDILDDYVAEENPVRVIDAYVDSLDLRGLKIGAHDNETGRPPFNPKDMLKLYIYGYFNRIRSSRRLECEANRNVEVMWLLNKLTPDHKTIANFRKNNAKGVKSVFRDFLQLCKRLGLYGNELMAIDGSKFMAVNSLENNYNHEKLDDRIRRIDEKLEKYLSELDENDRGETEGSKLTREEIAAVISALSERKEKYEGLKGELDQSGETQISTTDPDAKRMKRGDGASDICYNIQTAVDAKHKLMIEYEVTNQCNDKNLLAPMAIAAKEALGVENIAAAADTGYFIATDIAECMINGISPHVSSEHESVTLCIPVCENEANAPKDFDNQGKNVLIKECNVGICPLGNILYPRSYRASTGSAVYSNPKVCRVCTHRERCKEYDRELKVKMPRTEFTKEYNTQGLHIKQVTYAPDKKLLKKRKEIVEHPFGTVKRGMDTTYCLMKGIGNVCGEFALTFLTYNLKRAINILGVRGILQAIRG
jgi:transposase